MSTPEVVVACAWYNRADYIRDTVDSLLAQDFDSFEIVIVNDGSTDPRVREILDSYDDPRLRVIHQENTGFTVAIRRAIAESDAEYIAIQGAGDQSLPKRICKQCKFLRSNNHVGAISVSSYHISTETGKLIKKKIQEGSITHHILLGRFLIDHGSLMIRKEAYQSVNGYDRFFEFCQDRDLLIRMASDWDIHALPDIEYVKQVFSDGVSFAPEKKIKQRFFRNLSFCKNKKEKIQFFVNNPQKLQKATSSNRARHIFLSFKMIVLMLILKERYLLRKWIKMFIINLFSIFQLRF